MSEVAEASTEVETRARNLGWVPEEQFRGPKEKWVDAKEFVERGEEILPIVRANNRILNQKVTELDAENKRLAALFTASQEAIEALKTYQTEETERQVKAAKASLRAELKRAKKDGDTDLEVDIQEQIAELEKPAPKAAAAAPAPMATQTPAENPVHKAEFEAWRAENTWYDLDEVKAAAALAIANRLRRNGDTTQGRVFFDRVTAEIETTFGGTKGRTASKVEGAGGGAAAGAANGAARKYADLPAEAKAVCERQAEKLVGKGRAFKDKAAWQAHYVEQFFKEE